MTMILSAIIAIGLIFLAIKFPQVGKALAYAFDQFLKGLTKTK